MTYTQTRIENTVPLGGNLYLRTEELDITNYDDDGGGDGEAFTPQDVNFRRFVAVIPLVTDNAGYEAQYDEDAEAIRLYDGASEVASNGDNTATVKVLCIGV